MMQELVLDSNLQSRKDLAWWLYLFHAAKQLEAMLRCYDLKREDAAGTFVYSHHNWQIRSFWWYVVWMVVGGLLFATVVGIPLAFVVWGVAWLWKAYRLLRGFFALNDNKPMPD